MSTTTTRAIRGACVSTRARATKNVTRAMRGARAARASAARGEVRCERRECAREGEGARGGGGGAARARWSGGRSRARGEWIGFRVIGVRGRAGDRAGDAGVGTG